MKTFLYSSFLLIALSQSVIAAGLTLKYDVSAGGEAMKNVAKVCNQIKDITVSTSNDLSQALQVSSNSIQLQGGSNGSINVCCLVLDTPKGIIKVMVAKIYEDSAGSLIGMANTVNVTESSGMCF
jgi:hypothetical protein